MGKSTQSFGPMEGLLGSDRLTEALREKVREMILTLAEVSPACCYDSHDGQGIRGHQERRADRKLEAKIGSVMNSGRSHSGKFQLRT